jgi:hypothetical protein
LEIEKLADELEEWHPGSFTKNFGWGQGNGLQKLHEAIRIGFAGQLNDVRREIFRRRLEGAGVGFYVPANFFLFNRIIDGDDYIVVDELIFQALTSKHTKRFNELAVFALSLSHVGKFKGAALWQETPSLWAKRFVSDWIGRRHNWIVGKISADHIENFIASDKRYKGKTTRKVSTNLAFLLEQAEVYEMFSERITYWWVDAVFLTLDRLYLRLKGPDGLPSTDTVRKDFTRSGFDEISGPRSTEKDLALRHLFRLYEYCGGPDRFSPEAVDARTRQRIADLGTYAVPNDIAPVGALHRTNMRILKTIPATCALLAKEAGFRVLNALELADFDPVEFARKYVREALAELRAAGVSPTLTAEELLRLTREK